MELGMSLPGLEDRGRAVGRLPALGLLTLAGMLPAEWTCCYQSVSQVNDTLIDEIVQHQPDLVAISALTASIQEASRLSLRLREAGCQTVIGGLHATALPESLTPYFDAVVAGSGEGVWLTVLNNAIARKLKPVYQADRSPNLLWPTPRFDLLSGHSARLTLQSQRGCTLACEFCGASRLLGRFSEKPLEQVQRELQQIKLLRSRPLIELADDNTFAGNRDPFALLDLLQACQARWFTETDWRIGENRELVNRLAGAGCIQVLVGIESLCFQYPGMGEKVAEMKRILRAVDNLQNAGVAVNGCFVIGADGETNVSIDRLIQFLENSPFAEIQLTVQTPFPGTALYRRLATAGRLLAERDWSHYTLFDVTYQPDQMSVQELELGFRRAIGQLFQGVALTSRRNLREQIGRINVRNRL
jgi:radical SAM superfamily enzyme YgiQ (UPF0313 family)